MSRVELTTVELPVAPLGAENPLAPLAPPHPTPVLFEGAPYRPETALPYRNRDRFSRTFAPTRLRCAVLESDRLRATILLDYGGRVWSLLHKPSGRDLVYVNPVLQPVNIGIRGAWFSGGIEWNMSVFGHCVFTCEPVFAGIVDMGNGQAGLRLWEYERKRRLIWSVDLLAPEGSDFLWWSPRLTHVGETDVPMYWWACIATPEEEGCRVLAPAQAALEPYHDGRDGHRTLDLEAEAQATFPRLRERPTDTYFSIEVAGRPWIAAVGADDRGVAHVSDPKLQGRKMWSWGMGRSGRRWQEWLSPGGPPYIEIQAGLAPLQAQYVRMEAGADWSWVEAFGPIGTSANGSWAEALRRCQAAIDLALPITEWQARSEELARMRQRPMDDRLHSGAGWGALEVGLRRRYAQGKSQRLSELFPDDTCSHATDFWPQVLAKASLPDRDPTDEPGPFVSGAAWERLLVDISSACRHNWLYWLHRGVAHFEAGDRAEAEACWRASLDASRNGWALRNLGIIELQNGVEAGLAKVEEASGLLPSCAPLWEEACRLAADTRNHETLDRLLSRCPAEIRSLPRLRLARAVLDCSRGRFPEVAQYFRLPFDVADIREGETTVDQLWTDFQRASGQYPPAPVPPDYDFKMHDENARLSP
jgi:hypothetical protein